MSGDFDLAWYDVTQIDTLNEVTDGTLETSGVWTPLALQYERAKFGIGQNRSKHFGNSQTPTIDKRTKFWGLYELDLVPMKYSASPAWDWWSIVKNAFYGTGVEPAAPALRPSTISIGAKLNYTTAQFWTLLGCKHTQVQLSGKMTEDPLSLKISGMSRFATKNTTDYVQGSATRGADPPKEEIIPSTDVSIFLDGTDKSSDIEDFTLTLARGYKQLGRDSTNGLAFRAFAPRSFSGKLELNMGSTSLAQMDKFLADQNVTCEMRVQNSTGGKKIQFTAGKHQGADQEHKSEELSMLKLDIDGNSFLTSTL